MQGVNCIVSYYHFHFYDYENIIYGFTIDFIK